MRMFDKYTLSCGILTGSSCSVGLFRYFNSS